MKHLTLLFLFLFVLKVDISSAQAISKEELIYFTSDWKGERYDDGRPKVSDAILKRIKNIAIEEAWGFLRNQGYNNQFEGGWKMIHPNQAMVGRALTAQYMPKRPDMMKKMEDDGHAAGRIGPMNSWPIDMLNNGDIYIADAYGKIVDGTLIGDNLGNAIYAKSNNGVIFDGSLRDLEGLEKIDGFNAYVRDWDPSYLQETMLTGINIPIRIGRAIVLPGDVILAKKEGIIVIPAHLAEETVINAEFVALRDQFGHMRLREGTYTPGEIDTRWTDEIKKDFLSWLDKNESTLPMTRAELDAFMKKRNW